MALSGLEIYKLLPKTNCRECGFPTCLAFAMQLAAKKVDISKCPHVDEKTKAILAEASLPPIRLVSMGKDDSALDVGNETVLFRHEEKFHHPTGLGVIFEDNLTDADFERKKKILDSLTYERIGQNIKFNIAALKFSSNKEVFVNRAKKIANENKFAVILISNDLGVLEEALNNTASMRPLVYVSDKDKVNDAVELCLKFKVPLATKGDSLDELSNFGEQATKQGLQDLVLEPKEDTVRNRLAELTQIRRVALKKKFRPLGFPTLSIIGTGDPHEDVLEAATCIVKYSSIVLLKEVQNWQALALLTLRQSIFTDPQKPLQVEPKLYSIGATTKDSPLAVTTNFSLSYYTVLSEIEASKIPTYLLSVNTEGMSVLTAWAAEKFNADVIVEALNKCVVADSAPHKNIIIPGYVSVMSGDLEDKSGWKVVVGPREAAGIPQFLKNFKID